MVKTLLEVAGLFSFIGKEIDSRKNYDVRSSLAVRSVVYAQRTESYQSDCECDCDCQGTDCSGSDGSDCECTSDR